MWRRGEPSRDMVLPLEPQGVRRSYMCEQIIAQEITCTASLQSQRRHLHAQVARWDERHFPEDQTDLYPPLAYHWLFI